MVEGPTVEAPITGRCLCGRVAVTLYDAGTRIDVCHCSMCRTWGGGPFAGVSAEDFAVEGEANVATYRSSEWAERAFCRTCGSNLWFQFLPGKHFSFLAGLFTLPSAFTMHQQIFVDEKPQWYDFAQQTAMKTREDIVSEAKAAGYNFG